MHFYQSDATAPLSWLGGHGKRAAAQDQQKAWGGSQQEPCTVTDLWGHFANRVSAKTKGWGRRPTCCSCFKEKWYIRTTTTTKNLHCKPARLGLNTSVLNTSFNPHSYTWRDLPLLPSLYRWGNRLRKQSGLAKATSGRAGTGFEPTSWLPCAQRHSCSQRFLQPWWVSGPLWRNYLGAYFLTCRFLGPTLQVLI